MHNDALKAIIFDCAKLDKRVIEQIRDPSYKTYIVYDDSRNIEYLNLKGDVIGAEFSTSSHKRITSSQKKTKKSRKILK